MDLQWVSESVKMPLMRFIAALGNSNLPGVFEFVAGFLAQGLALKSATRDLRYPPCSLPWRLTGDRHPEAAVLPQYLSPPSGFNGLF